MKFIGILLFVFAVLSACDSSKHGEIGDINSTKTKEHVNIPGTRVFIIPPEGFQISRSTGELVKPVNDEESCSIRISDSIGKPFIQFSKEEVTKGSEIPIGDFKEIRVNGYNGIYRTTADFMFFYNPIFLDFGDSSFSVSIFAYTSDGDSIAKEG